MNVVGASAKPEITPESHDGVGVKWPGSKDSSEKIRRIAELEANMRDMQTAMATCNAKIVEMGVNERNSALTIVQLQSQISILREESRQTQKEYDESPASKEFVFEQTREVHRAAIELTQTVNARVSNLRQFTVRKLDQATDHTDLSKNELDAKFEDKIREVDAKIEAGSRYLTQIVHDFGFKIMDISESIKNIESQMGWSQDDITEFSDDELHLVPYHAHNVVHPTPHTTIVPPHRRLMPPPVSTKASHGKPLFDLPPDDPSRVPALTAKDWTFNALWASLQANATKSQQLA
jgi:hypothetical protein